MRILDVVGDKPLDQVGLYLTVTEAEELRDTIAGLLSNREAHHEHVSSEDFKKEITISLYQIQPISSFDERSRKLIEDDV